MVRIHTLNKLKLLNYKLQRPNIEYWSWHFLWTFSFLFFIFLSQKRNHFKTIPKAKNDHCIVIIIDKHCEFWEKERKCFFFLENVKMGDNERFQESIFALKITTMQISQIHKFHLEQKCSYYSSRGRPVSKLNNKSSSMIGNIENLTTFEIHLFCTL